MFRAGKNNYQMSSKGTLIQCELTSASFPSCSLLSLVVDECKCWNHKGHKGTRRKKSRNADSGNFRQTLKRLDGVQAAGFSSSSRFQFPKRAPASYVLCKNSRSVVFGDDARRTSSYIRKNSCIWG
jgi:hypothetical protein